MARAAGSARSQSGGKGAAIHTGYRARIKALVRGGSALCHLAPVAEFDSHQPADPPIRSGNVGTYGGRG